MFINNDSLRDRSVRRFTPGDGRLERVSDSDLVLFYCRSDALSSLTVRWLSDFRRMPTRLMPPLLDVVRCRWPFRRISVSGIWPGIHGEVAPRVDANAIGMHITCPVQPPLVRGFSAPPWLRATVSMIAGCCGPPGRKSIF
jgi:hypothetical protein